MLVDPTYGYSVNASQQTFNLRAVLSLARREDGHHSVPWDGVAILVLLAEPPCWMSTLVYAQLAYLVVFATVVAPVHNAPIVGNTDPEHVADSTTSLA